MDRLSGENLTSRSQAASLFRRLEPPSFLERDYIWVYICVLSQLLLDCTNYFVKGLVPLKIK